ncbi:branched-chain amino acid ABC transporter permease [Candidatus Bathyarchaeota archaeon]|nr:branched-chain amino acid ABC transporter permease [Candidatus Bathyarchaeota archaeon]
MIDPIITASIVYSALFGLMAIGLTITYLTTKVPNFAYGSFVTIGIYVAFSLSTIYKITPYGSLPVAFFVGSLSSVAMYLGILRMLARRGASLVGLMIATLAIDIAFLGIFGIYSDYLYRTYRIIQSANFPQLPGDFTLLGVSGIVFVAPIALVLITLALFALLTMTRLGVSLRAAIENPSLARVLGINVEVVYVFAWALAGGLAGMSGAFYTLWLPGGIDVGSKLIVEIFAASVLGGLSSIFGAALGGVIIGASEILLTTAGIDLFGSGVGLFQKGIPLVIMIITLLVLPQGLVSLNLSKIFSLFDATIQRFLRMIRVSR